MTSNIDQPEAVIEEQNSSVYIDDYSQLRLSYYRHPGNITISTENEESEYTTDTAVTIETNLSDVSIKENCQKLRNYHISQIPDLPHPSFTVASIIASASQRMGSFNFKYNDKIEEKGNTREPCKYEKFSPQRKSSLKPDQFCADK